MPRRPGQRPSFKEPPSFAGKYAFLIAGGLLFCLLAGGLIVAWTEFQHSRRLQGIYRGMGATGEATPEAAPATPPTALPADTELLAGAESRTLRALPADSPERSGDLRVDWQPAPLSDSEKMTIQKALASFWSAGKWKDKVAYVRDAARVAPIMQEYYETHRRKEPRAGKFISAAAYVAAPFELLHVIYENAQGDRPLELAFIRDADGAYKLDWESYAGSGDVSWESLPKERPTKPVLLRAYAVQDDYYNYEFRDAARYVCLKLSSIDFEQVLYAYALRDGELAKQIDAEAPAGENHPLTVRIAYPANAQSRNCVKLEAVVAGRWLLLDEQR